MERTGQLMGEAGNKLAGLIRFKLARDDVKQGASIDKLLEVSRKYIRPYVINRHPPGEASNLHLLGSTSYAAGNPIHIEGDSLTRIFKAYHRHAYAKNNKTPARAMAHKLTNILTHFHEQAERQGLQIPWDKAPPALKGTETSHISRVPLLREHNILATMNPPLSPDSGLLQHRRWAFDPDVRGLERDIPGLQYGVGPRLSRHAIKRLAEVPIKRAADYAPGLPRKDEYGDPLGTLKPGDTTGFFLQKHETARNPRRPHADMRLGNPETNLFSWALPKAKMPEPGEKALAVQTQLHRYDYGSFEGRLGKGYGHGNVSRMDLGKAIIGKVTPSTVSFTLGHKKVPTRYVLIHTKGKDGRQWLLMGQPDPDTAGDVKPIIKQISAASMDDALEQASTVQAATDKAASVNPSKVMQAMRRGDVDALRMYEQALRTPTGAKNLKGALNMAAESATEQGLKLAVDQTRLLYLKRHAEAGHRWAQALLSKIGQHGANKTNTAYRLANPPPPVQRTPPLPNPPSLRAKQLQFWPKQAATPPYMTNDIARQLVGDRPYPMDYLHGEVDEFSQAIKAKRIQDIKEELQDVLYAAQMLASQHTGENMPILGADQKVQEFLRRKQMFEHMFAQRQIPFSTAYLAGGSNYKKPEKIVAAFGAAGHTITPEEAVQLASSAEGSVKQAFEIPPAVMMGADDVPLAIIRWWKNRQQNKDSNATIKTALSKTQILLGALTGGVVGNESAKPSQRRSHAEYNAATQAAGPTSRFLHPRPPAGTALLMTPRQGERYIARNGIPRHEQLARTIRYNLRNPDTGGFYHRDPKHEPFVLSSRQGPDAVLRHEIGHSLATNEAVQKGDLQSINPLASKLRSILTGARRTPLYRSEDDAWNRGGVDVNDPVRRAALKTYETGINGGAYTGRGVIAGAAAGAAVSPLLRAIRTVVKSASPSRWIKRQVLESLRHPLSPAGKSVLRPKLSGKLEKMMREAAKTVHREPDTATAAFVGWGLGHAIPLPGASLLAGNLAAKGYRQVRTPLRNLSNKMLGTKFTQPVLKPADVSGLKVKSGSALERVRLQFLGGSGQLKTSAVVEVADNPSTRAQGLMYRDEVPAGTGMFFDKVGSYWMKNVLVPLDIVFLAKDGTVLEKQAMLPPADALDTPTYSPADKNAQYAVELPGGWFDRSGIEVGDIVGVVPA